MQWLAVVFTVLFGVTNSEFYDSYSGDEITTTRYEQLNRTGLVPICAFQVAPCDPHEPRRLDGSCNNLKYPSRGAANTPFRRMLPPVFSAGGDLRLSQSGKPLPLVRPLRVALMSDGRISSHQFTQMIANFNVFFVGEITSLQDTVNYVLGTRTCCQPGGEQDPRCIPIKVEDDDPHLRRSNVRCMNLTRSITFQRMGCVSDDVPPARINTAMPMLDLSSVYGNEEVRARRGREFSRGRLRSELLNGKEWPPNGGRVCVNNVPPLETRCHDAPVPASNSILGLNLVFMWFYRSHNVIADALWEMNPCWGDDQLYYKARDINIAFFVQIVYYEMMPLLLGWEYLAYNKVVYPGGGHVDDYEPTLPPGTSIDYVTATRWFHTLQEGRLKLYTGEGRQYAEYSAVDFILRTGALPIDNNIEGVTQGVFRQPGANVDPVVDTDVGERILGRLQFASDVISSDLMKGRDLGIPPYNRYRKRCKLPEAKKFKDLLGWMDQTQVEAMAAFYDDPNDIDLMAALLAEWPMPGAAVGPTLGCIMAEQLQYWRRSDRFWYEHTDHPGAFTADQLLEIRKMTLSKLLCINGDAVREIQPNSFLLPGPGNEMRKCSTYEMPNLIAFRDDSCHLKHTPSQMTYPTSYPQKSVSLSQNTYPNTYPQKSDNLGYIDRGQEYMDNPMKSSYPNAYNSNPLLSTNPYRSISNNEGYPYENPLSSTYKEYPSIADAYPNVNPNAERQINHMTGSGGLNPSTRMYDDFYTDNLKNQPGDKSLLQSYSNANPFQIFVR